MKTLTAQDENYLKAVWSDEEWDRTTTNGTLAAALGLAPSSVTEAVRKLADAGLVTHARYGAVSLTDAGRRIAVAIVRKHRIIETFLVAELGYAWGDVHDEAEILEHAVSDRFIDALDARLGRPGRDPHGDPIPLADGTLPDGGERPLADIAPGPRVFGGQVLQRRHQRLRHVHPAVGPEVAPRIRLCYSSRHRSINSRTFARSFRPGCASTPELTSTPHGPTAATAAFTFAGPSPPASSTGHGLRCTKERAAAQSPTCPVPPGECGL